MKTGRPLLSMGLLIAVLPCSYLLAAASNDEPKPTKDLPVTAAKETVKAETGVTQTSAALQTDGPKKKESAAATPASPNAAATNAATAANPNATWIHTVRLTVDGNVAGRITAFDSAGQRKPARARVGFVQKGQITAGASSDEWGSFQVLHLTPGVYTVIASGTDGVGILWIRVLPYDENVKGENILELALARSADAELLSAIKSGKVGKTKSPVSKAAGQK